MQRTSHSFHSETLVSTRTWSYCLNHGVRVMLQNLQFFRFIFDKNLIKKPSLPVSKHATFQILIGLNEIKIDISLLLFYCKKRLEYFDLLNHRTNTFVLKTVSSTQIKFRFKRHHFLLQDLQVFLLNISSTHTVRWVRRGY